MKILLIQLLTIQYEIGQLICQKIASYFIKSPMRTSQLSSQSYINEVLNGNPRRSYEVLRMPKDVFDNLCHWFTLLVCLLGQ